MSLTRQLARLEERIEQMRSKLGIDRDRLDDEFIDQPQRYSDAGDIYALAISIRDMAKERLERADAQLLLDKLSADRPRKLTKDAAMAEIMLDPDHQAAHARYIHAQRVANSASSLREDFRQRGYALRELTELWVGQYFERDSANSGTASTQKVRYEQTKQRMHLRRRERLRRNDEHGD